MGKKKRYCPKCGASLKKSDKYCTKCGYSFKKRKKIKIKNIVLVIIIILIIWTAIRLISGKPIIPQPLLDLLKSKP